MGPAGAFAVAEMAGLSKMSGKYEDYAKRYVGLDRVDDRFDDRTEHVRVCADCLYFVRIRRRWLSSLVACCDRPEARHIVTGEPDTCYHMRNCGACAEEGKIYEERP